MKDLFDIRFEKIMRAQDRLSKSQANTDIQLKELRKSQAQTDKQLKETDKQLRETDKQLLKTDKQLLKTDIQLLKTDKQLRELGVQIGGLGRKFGNFAEGMAFPSMEKILRKRFKMDVVSVRVKSCKNGHNEELDMLGYSNSGKNQAYIIEIKSRLKEEGLEDLLRKLNDFSLFFPEHNKKKLFGILVCVDSPESLEKKVLKKGIYLGKMNEESFSLQIPENFKPKSFQN